MSLAATGAEVIIHSLGPFPTIHFRFSLPWASTSAGLNYLLGRETQAFILKVFSLVHVRLRLSQFCKWHHSYGRKQRGTKEPLDEGERGQWKSWLKIQHAKKLSSWHLVPLLHGKWMGKQWKQWQTFIFLDSRITADGDCSHEIKRHLLLARKPLPNLAH